MEDKNADLLSILFNKRRLSALGPGGLQRKIAIAHTTEETQDAAPVPHVDAGMGIKADGRIFDGSLKINQPGICSRALGIERS
jgi:hypothetical protein